VTAEELLTVLVNVAAGGVRDVHRNRRLHICRDGILKAPDVRGVAASQRRGQAASRSAGRDQDRAREDRETLKALSALNSPPASKLDTEPRGSANATSPRVQPLFPSNSSVEVPLQPVKLCEGIREGGRDVRSRLAVQPVYLDEPSTSGRVPERAS
jgi:hypothetical protein